MRTARLHVTLCLTLLLAACGKNISDKSVNLYDLQQMARIHARDGEKLLLIDVRTAETFAAGHIPGARNIRLPEVREDDLDPALQKYKQIVVYGQNAGSASAMAMAKRLLTAGYSDVVLFKPGFDAWKSAGMAVQPAAN